MNRYDEIDKLNLYSSMLEKHYTEKQIDSDIACYIYDFLNGDINNLPPFKVLYNLIDSASVGDKISEGYGVIVYLGKIENSDFNEIIIEMEINVDKNRKRIDKITCSKHSYVLINRKKAIKFDDSIKDDTRFKDYPKINKNRIKFLQNYLSKFEISNRKQKSKC